ncbi:MAG: hypothetical protein KGN79_08040 [Acidobacteriota bacterium]|nr:hypothetical protein [Acidobacteriota bacterium]
MNERLHPQSLTEVLDRTVQIYRGRFLVFFGIALVPSAVMLAALLIVVGTFAGLGLRNIATDTSGSTQLLAGSIFVLIALVSLPLFVGSTALGYAALCHAAAETNFGNTITIRQAYKAAWKRGWNQVGLLLLQAVFVGIIPFSVLFFIGFVSAMASVATAGSGSTGGAIAGFLTLLVMGALAVATIYVLLRICLAFPANIVERISAWKAIVRSNALSNGTRGRAFVLFLLGWALNQAVLIALFVPLVLVIAFVPGMQGPEHQGAVGALAALFLYGGTFAAQAFIRPVYGIGLTLFYFDQRIRKEGFDIEWMMRQAGLVAAAPAAAASVPWTGAIPSVVNAATAQAENRTESTAIESDLGSIPKAGDSM